MDKLEYWKKSKKLGEREFGFRRKKNWLFFKEIRGRGGEASLRQTAEVFRL